MEIALSKSSRYPHYPLFSPIYAEVLLCNILDLQFESIHLKLVLLRLHLHRIVLQLTGQAPGHLVIAFFITINIVLIIVTSQ